MGDQPDPLFFKLFDNERTSLLLDCLEKGYATAQHGYKEAQSRGANQYTFGYDLYHYVVHEIKEGIQADPLGFQVVPEKNALLFRLKLGEFTLGCHRVGRTEADDINTHFPNNGGAILHMVPNPYLPGLLPEVNQLRNVVLAHMGNPDDGLCAAYLCFPIQAEGGHISQWAYSLELHRLRRPETLATLANTTPSAHEIPPAAFRRKR